MRKQSDRILLAPTDLSNFLSCHHQSALDVTAAEGRMKRPTRFGPVLDELRERGRAHERRYLAHLENLGLSIVRPGEPDRDGKINESSELENTLSAMRSGVDVIYQARLADADWSGYADFLRKVDHPSNLGDWSYEVIDTKLARDTRAGTVLQLCVYSYLVEKLQGLRPEYMHVVTPGNYYAPLPYRIDDYGAYFRLLEKGIHNFIREPTETYPELVPHCDLCAWWEQCEERRRDDDHLCYVAGIRSNQIKSLRAVGIDRLEDLARLDEVPDPEQGSKEALTRIRDQARIQVRGREQSSPCHEVLKPLDEEHGLALLPTPTEDDIFLDFEGNHFAEESSVHEYLTGFIHRDSAGKKIYSALWARTLEEEQRAFERFVDIAIETRDRNPKAHIYHFAPYEPTALKKLSGRFATRGVELDELLRGDAFVDLYTVVRRSLIASVERYSIKDLEPFFGYQRTQDLREASMGRRLVEHAIEAGEYDETIAEQCRIVEDYNREDCESAERLRDWLEEIRAEVISKGHKLQRPDLKEGEASEEISALDQELQRLRDGLLEGVPIDPETRSDEEQARFVLAHMMEFHRREDKATWWEKFRLLDLDEEDYPDERRAISGLSFQEVLDPKAAPLQRYTFPPQELDARSGDGVFDRAGNRIGTVESVSYLDRTIDIKKSKKSADDHPSGVVFHNRFRSDLLRDSLMRLGESVLKRGFTGQLPYQAGLELLMRRPSPLIGADGSLQQTGESTIEAACRLALKLNGNILAIQGPPGTGKTYTGAQIICALVDAGLKVGVTAVSHKVIENLLEGAREAAQVQGLRLRAVHKQAGDYEGAWGIERLDDYGIISEQLGDSRINVVGGTAWCWVRGEFEQSVDVLIVDEAGQMSLSNVLAACPGGRSLILLGDPQQLEQPLQSSHPEGSEVSALYHLLHGAETMPPDKGLFLEETYRLHPEIARFTSEVYYEGKVRSRPGLEHQTVIPNTGKSLKIEGSGLRYMPVEHSGNQARSPEEAEAVSRIVRDLLENGNWRDKDETTRPMKENDILIVAPYNAQVSALIETIPRMQYRIGTVDRFQGQEAPVVIYSMTSSSPEDAPRGMDFLYDRHRFNVATSRAKALCILVGNPALFKPECHTPRQMRNANGFCRYLELAKIVNCPF